MKEKTNDNIIKLAVLFYTCSIIGYIYEVILALIMDGKLTNPGILTGPWLPIYGTGSLIISLFNKFKRKPLIIFLCSFFSSGILEYICGYILLEFFNKRLWDYTGWFLNIDGFVCFLSAFCFAAGSLIIIYYLMPLINKIVRRTNTVITKAVLITLSILFLGDIILQVAK